MIRHLQDLTPDRWFNVSVSADQTTAEVDIVGVIGRDTDSASLINSIRNLKTLKTLNVLINSVGGYIGDGLGILNYLASLKGVVVNTVNIGYALSMGSILLQAASNGGKRMMAENALIMIHKPQGGTWGDARDLRSEADALDKHEQALMSIYLKKMPVSADELKTLLAQTTWYTAQEALDAGLIDEISGAIDTDTAANQIPLNVWKNIYDSGLKNMPENMQAQLSRRLNLDPSALKAALPQATGAGIPTPEPMPAQPPTVDLAAAQAQWQAAENQRRNEVLAVFTPFGGLAGRYAELASTALADMSYTADKARENLLAVMGKESPAPVGSQIEITDDQTDKLIDAAVNSLHARAGLTPLVQGNPLAFMSLRDLAQASLQRQGVTAQGLNPLEMVGRAFAMSTSDFPIILERTITQAVLLAYRKRALTFQRWCAIGSVSDFRTHDRLRLGSFGNLDAKLENGEYKYKAIPDGEKEKVSIGTKGNLIAITREAIINDDLGYFTRMSTMLGDAAARTVEADVYKFLLSNPKLSDGMPLFHSKHKNLQAAAAMSEASLDAMRVAMAAHTDINGNDELDISPAFLLVASAMQLTADRWMKSAVLPGQDNAALMNAVANMAEPIATSRLNSQGNAYYLFANPNDAPVIEVNYLNGVSEPYIDSKEGWKTDGTEMKVRLDYGVDVIDYRGAQFNPGVQQ